MRGDDDDALAQGDHARRHRPGASPRVLAAPLNGFGGVDLAGLAAEHGTPLYLYDGGAIRARLRAYREAFRRWDAIVAYAVKANGNLGILRLVAEEGGGADIVSGGELFRARRAGIPGDRIVFSGVGKTEVEITQALEEGVLLLNVESLPELSAVERVAARLGVRARIGIRVNPDVDPRTHAYVATGHKESKFGLDPDAAREAYRRAAASPHLEPAGLHIHIGSQIVEAGPFVAALERAVDLLQEVRAGGAPVRFLDIGGGLGVRYRDESPPSPADLAAALGAHLDRAGCRVILEPGRSVVAEAGILLTRVLYVKESLARTYVIVDAAMNDLVRPALYDAHHPVVPVGGAGGPEIECDIVGPVCETGDFLARGRRIPRPGAGDLLAVLCAGAYGSSMASNYNARGRPAEVLVDGGAARLVRRRETAADLVAPEIGLEAGPPGWPDEGIEEI